MNPLLLIEEECPKDEVVRSERGGDFLRALKQTAFINFFLVRFQAD